MGNHAIVYIIYENSCKKKEVNEEALKDSAKGEILYR